MTSTLKYVNVHLLTEVVKLLLNGEPVFIIRAQDRLAAGAVASYLDSAMAVGARNQERVAEALREIKLWQQANRNRVKLPD